MYFQITYVIFNYLKIYSFFNINHCDFYGFYIFLMLLYMNSIKNKKDKSGLPPQNSDYIISSEKKFRVYPIEKYYHWGKKRGRVKYLYDEDYEEYNLNELIDVLKENDYGYHCRINPKREYIFYGDLDGYKQNINIFIVQFTDFLHKIYQIKISRNDVKYTQNIGDDTSYHFTVPNIFCSVRKMKEIVLHFRKKFIDDFIIKTEKGTTKYILDTTVYSEKFFRYPNQSKELNENTKHIVKYGTIQDFIIAYIPPNSVNIDKYKDNSVQKKSKRKPKKKPIPKKNDNIKNDDNIDKIIKKSRFYKQFFIYKQFFDRCYEQIRFDDYDEWIKIGMALKNIYNMEGFDIFNYGSSKSKTYGGIEKTRKKYESFKYKHKGYNVGTLYIIAKEDNRDEYSKILLENNLILTEYEFAEKIQELAGNRFIYKNISGDKYQLYCYNGKYWTKSNILLRKFISTELYDYYKHLINDVYSRSLNYNNYLKIITSLKRLSMVKNIIERYKEFGVKDIEFDSKWWLLGFKNIVFDFKIGEFREYRFDDYVTMTTRYDWIEPEQIQIDKINSMINKIMPIQEEKELLLTLFSTALEGRALEKFIILNGNGRNGKGCINDILLLALGDYAILANESILFEKSKTGCNPEKANLHKKRLVLFREPPEKSKFENSAVKILTGGGKFSARSLYDNQTEKILHSTTFVECNKRPMFAEEPKIADVERLIDIHYRSTFTSDLELIDENNYFYPQDATLKNFEFQHEHKFALLKILFEYHKKYRDNNYKLIVPNSIKKRTNEYLEMSCNILQWFKDQYMKTNDKKDVSKLRDIFKHFRESEYYYNLTKREKRRYNYRYFCNYFRENIFLRRFYRDRYQPKKSINMRNIIVGWLENDQNSEYSDNE